MEEASMALGARLVAGMGGPCVVGPLILTDLVARTRTESWCLACQCPHICWCEKRWQESTSLSPESLSYDKLSFTPGHLQGTWPATAQFPKTLFFWAPMGQCNLQPENGESPLLLIHLQWCHLVELETGMHWKSLMLKARDWCPHPRLVCHVFMVMVIFGLHYTGAERQHLVTDRIFNNHENMKVKAF